MKSKVCVLLAALFAVAPLRGLDDTVTKLNTSDLSVETGPPWNMIIFFTGPAPANGSPYLAGGNWRIEWQTKKTDTPTIVSVDGPPTITADGSAIRIPLSGTLPSQDQANKVFWTVLLLSTEIPFTIVSNTPKPQTQSKSCADKDAGTGTGGPFFCPPKATDTVPDVSFSGSYLAGGGTNPIYQFELKGGLVFPKRVPHLPADIGVTSQVEINQNTKPPSHRTRFDPDSITAGLAFTNQISFQANRTHLTGMRFQAQLPEGEFSRSDPSSNIIAAGLATIDFAPWQPTPSIYFTMYPFLGMEAGRNLNRPTAIDKVPVDLSRFKGIARGYAGADAKFALSAKDAKSDIFSISGTYRVRLPATDEPFIETIHEVTSVSLTSKARHWVEADIAYTLPEWKYFSLSAQYQYGELPPFFNFVDHKFTLGFKLQGMQTRGKSSSTKLVK